MWNQLLNRDAMYMQVSHVTFLLAFMVWAYRKRYFGASLFLLSYTVSSAYHICWGIAKNPTQYDSNSVCVSPNVTLTWTLLISDLFFANLAPLHALFWLLPHRGYTIYYRHFLSFITAIIIVFVGVSTKFYTNVTLDGEDSSLWIALAVFLWFFFLYAFHVYTFLYASTTTTTKSKNGVIDRIIGYYQKTFQVYLLIFALVFCLGGLFIWVGYQRLYPDSYWVSHPGWHIIIGLAGALYGLALRPYEDYATIPLIEAKRKPRYSDRYSMNRRDDDDDDGSEEADGDDDNVREAEEYNNNNNSENEDEQD